MLGVCFVPLVPVPRVTTLGDSIEEAMRKPPDGWLEWLREFGL